MKLKIAIAQMNSQHDFETNYTQLIEFLKQAKSQGAQALFLPEMFLSLSAGGPEPIPLDSPEFLGSLAKEYSLAILGGSCAYLEEDRLLNRSFNFDEQGNDLGHYDKMHLFKCNHPEIVFDESTVYSNGNRPKIIEWNDLKIGLSICFDLRFSGLYEYYRAQKCDLISISSAFTKPTGVAHWHTLVRARAIETQSFVIASNQWGRHNDKVETFGHSLVVNPWGEILADLGEGVKLETLEIDLDQIQEARSRIIMEALI